jgi:hypothetical protein
MRILLILVATLVFLGVLWGPAFMVALRYWRRGDAGAFGQLRYLYPAQLIVAVALAFTADLLGLRQPAALLAGATVCVGVCGALFISLRQLLLSKRT